MSVESRRPRMALFRRTRPGIPDFLTAHAREQVKSLECFFDVRVIEGDCDYDLVCDQLQPDLCVFESGVYAGRRVIRNIAAHPDIPRLGFLHADAFDSSRAAFVADMARWDVHWYFTTSMSMAEYTPEIAERLFVWPNAIDPGVFHDYGLEKNIPVLFTGSQAWHYPWRNAVSRVITPEFITMTMPHFGWGTERGTERMLHGEDYARLLNASIFVPTCGTVTRDVVRKHLEIPASMACLVTERTASVEAFGFADMVNCVFAGDSDVVDKLQYLLRHPEELDRVTRAGHRLVHDRHTLRERSQVLQWFELVTEHGIEIQLTQRWPDGVLSLAESGAGLDSAVVVSSGRDRQLIASGWQALLRGNYADAERDFRQCMNFFFMPEGAVGLTHARLLQGDWPGAREWMSRAMTSAMSYFGAHEPDPVQWACEIRVLMCSGDVAAATAAADAYPSMRHPELDRVRGAVAVLTGRAPLEPANATARASVCPVPAVSPDVWIRQLSAMLRACGQPESATLLAGLGSLESTGATVRAARPAPGSIRGVRRVETRLAQLRKGDRSAFERWLRSRLSPLKRRLTSDAWSRSIGDYAKREPASHAIIVLGHDRWSRSTRAVRRGVMENPEMRGVTSIGSANRLWSLSGRPRGVRAEAEMTHRATESLTGLGDAAAPLVFLTRNGASLVPDTEILRRAATVILEGVNEPSGHRILRELIDRREFTLVDHRPGQGTGCAVLRRSSEVTGAQGERTVFDGHPPG